MVDGLRVPGTLVDAPVVALRLDARHGAARTAKQQEKEEQRRVGREERKKQHPRETSEEERPLYSLGDALKDGLGHIDASPIGDTRSKLEAFIEAAEATPLRHDTHRSASGKDG